MDTRNPERGIWRRFLLLVPLGLALALCAYLYVRGVCGTYTVQSTLPLGQVPESDIALDPQDVVEVAQVRKGDAGQACITFRALRDGQAQASVEMDDAYEVWDLRVQDGTVIEGGVNFSGWEAVLAAFLAFLAAAMVLFASVVMRLARRSWYGYAMVAAGGGALFCLFQILSLAAALVTRSVGDMRGLAYLMVSAAERFSTVVLVPVGVVSVLVCISNVSLIRHEGLRPQNLLGIAAGVLWGVVQLAWFLLRDALEQALDMSVLMVAETLLFCAITYGECLLVSTIVCAWSASRHVPRHAARYLVVLGCGIRPDGTPTPLLAGRLDRALAFDQACVGRGEDPATYVPSGGKGSDEVTSEAVSMAGYLQGHGVSEERIALEDRSVSTQQNMAFSREVILGHEGDADARPSVVFCTTNYHVFRGYVCAHMAGMEVEGLGASTRAYFWPNAFLREFAGLLVWEWKSILQLYAVIAAAYGLAAYAFMLSM